MPNNHIQVSVSKQFLILMIMLLLMTMLIICFLSCAGWIKVVLIALVIMYGRRMLFQHVLLLSPSSIIGISQDSYGWHLHTKDNARHTVSLSGDSTVTNYVSVLRFADSIKACKYACILFRDSFDCLDAYRQFILMLVLHK